MRYLISSKILSYVEHVEEVKHDQMGSVNAAWPVETLN